MPRRKSSSASRSLLPYRRRRYLSLQALGISPADLAQDTEAWASLSGALPTSPAVGNGDANTGSASQSGAGGSGWSGLGGGGMGWDSSANLGDVNADTWGTGTGVGWDDDADCNWGAPPQEPTCTMSIGWNDDDDVDLVAAHVVKSPCTCGKCIAPDAPAGTATTTSSM
ncbi:hypothetical protein B0H15DRAFT_957081 [Mycena belliarum]|uniref:Uncharacterized protein n=1 Tax=Mycena belliarum TaxID=1033014 RepID=A0AAD6TNH8_9AGAR|nr:hypothetical protein B0H15DRAFT_957081 [Mycena belliae]